MEEKVRLPDPLEGREERLPQFGRKVVDEPHRVDEDRLPAAGKPELPGGWVERGEELVRHEDVGPRQPVEEGRFSGVGVPDERDHGEPDFPAPLIMERTRPAHRGQLPLELPDLRADAATILLELLLPRSPGADPAAEPRQFLPPPREPPEPERQLGEFHLELPLPGARALGEDVEDDLAAVEGLHVELLFEKRLLLRLEQVLEDHQVRPQRFDLLLQADEGPLPDDRGRVLRVDALHAGRHHLRPRREDEVLQLVHHLGDVQHYRRSADPLPVGVDEEGALVARFRDHP